MCVCVLSGLPDVVRVEGKFKNLCQEMFSEEKRMSVTIIYAIFQI